MKENMKRKIAMLLTLLGVTSIVIGTTFAIYENTINTNKNHIIKTGVVNFTLTESTNGIVLNNLQELTDYEGMAQEEYYEFTIKNTGNTITDYEISLVDKPNSSYTGTILNEKYIKVGLLKNNSKEIIVNLKDVNRLIDKVTLDVEDTVNYKLRLWLDFGNLEDEAKEALVGQKIFLALKINGIQNVNKVPTGADTLIKLTDNKDNSGLYTITHAKDSTLQIGTNEDITEYRYRGASPKNYVTFNNEVWRILGVFPTDDGTGNIENRIKLIKDQSIGEYKWDDGTIAYNYTKNDNLMLLQDKNKLKVKYLEKKNKNNFIDLAIAEPAKSALNNWARPASLNTYLNKTYLNALSTTSQNMIGDTKYYLGGGGNNSNFNSSVDFYSYERKIKNTKSNEFYYDKNPNSWVGRLGLMYVSDYGYASDNCETKALNDYNNSNDLRICNNTNWLFNLKKLEATITQYSNTSTSIHYIADNGTVVSTYQASLAQTVVRPTLYLKSEVRIIDGDGTSTNPYILSSDGKVAFPEITLFEVQENYPSVTVKQGTYPISEYCFLTNDSNMNNCTWTTNLESITKCCAGGNKNYNNKFYLYVKDTKGNISSQIYETYYGSGVLAPCKC